MPQLTRFPLVIHMIKRYSITLPKAKFSKEYSASVNPFYKPFFNAGPGQKLPVITSDNPHRVEMFQWGIIPFTSSDSHIADKLINARAKTLFIKEPFCDLVQKKRCIIPADSFYLWQEKFNVSTPFRVQLATESPFNIAGVWEEWKMEGEEEGKMFGSFTMITRESQENIFEYSDRMPLILNDEQTKAWLDDRIDESFISDILASKEEMKLKVYKVTNLVNDLKNNTRRVVKEINAPLPGDTLSLF